MATIILQAAGAALGGLFGSVGATIGTAAGALAGYALDKSWLTPGRTLEGPRLAEQKPFTAEEGATLPRAYGSVRVSGTLIWATRFVEKKTTRRQGGKGGGAKSTEYSYYANAAFALCEGEIACVRRIWADGREIDQEKFNIRVYRGTEDQLADPLIAVKQGSGNAPAYRGTAYVVVERMPIDDYGDRLPQMQFEVLRPVGLLHRKVRAVTLIPGSTEYGLSPGLVTRKVRRGETMELNRHVLHAGSDMAASLDELQALCPALEHVALVVSWFGTDLRAGSCQVVPGVATRDANGLSDTWEVSGTSRAGARLLSTVDGKPAFGGTPGDRSVMDAIRAIKARGLKVTLYPFVMMDVPPGNSLPDPYGGSAQGTYPWRGRITVQPAPGRPGTPDKTPAARTAVQAFCGTAAVGAFDAEDDTIAFSGSGWGYRRMVLHYAQLAKAAGGVNAFLLGSELRGLSTLRDGAGAFPFVEALCQLAADVRGVLGSAAKITYGADWTEYFGHHPADGSGDVLFHLDALWAHPAIDAVGIDNYMPLADWRDGDYAGGNPDGAASPADPKALRDAIAGGEGFSWFYPSDAARAGRVREAIADGAYGKPWVFRFKDLKSWWSNAHRNRIGGVEQSTPTAWVPQSKPFWFTELGCPAIDKGPNQPNVFADPKSSESAIPYFSHGGRSDLGQRRFLEAHLRWWDAADEAFLPDANPVSSLTAERMVDLSRLYLWAWDARPFPAFPSCTDQWSDGGNWQFGHWLNGRLEAPAAGDLINAILADHGLPPADVDDAEGSVQGFLAEPAAARDAIEPILQVFGLDMGESGGRFMVRAQSSGGSVVEFPDWIAAGKAAARTSERQPDHDLPAEVSLDFRDVFQEYQSASVRSVRLQPGGRRQEQQRFPGALDKDAAQALAEDWLRRRWAARETLEFSLAPQATVEPGALIRLPARSDALFRVTEVEKGLTSKVKARRHAQAVPVPWRPAVLRPPAERSRASSGAPLMLLLDLPSTGGNRPAEEQFRVALWKKPWAPQLLYASPGGSGFSLRAAIAQAANAGALADPLAPGKGSGRMSFGDALKLELFDGEAASVDRLALLSGANALAVRSAAGAWEVIQFERAEEVALGVFRLSNLLRGQLGTEDAMDAGAPAGADAVLLDEAVVPTGLLPSETGLTLNWKAGGAGQDFSDRWFTTESAAGGLRGKLPLAPVHLRAKPDGAGGIAFTWVRRGRIDADSWEGADIPLGEETEQYFVEVAAAGWPVVRRATCAAANWTYPAVALAFDFFLLTPAFLDVTVRQRGTGVGWGLPARRRFATAGLLS